MRKTRKTGKPPFVLRVRRLWAVLALLLAIQGGILPARALTSSSQDQDAQKDYFNYDYAYLEDENSVYLALTYDELLTLFQQEGNYVVLFGGSWCNNTNPVIGYINQVAKEYGVDTIYTFDFRLDGMTADTHVRESDGATHGGSPVAGAAYNYLYGELVERYLNNLDRYVEYQIGTENQFVYTNAQGETVALPKVQVPFLFLYNKDHVDGEGQPAQIVSGLELMMSSSDFVDENNSPLEEAIAEYKDILRAQVFDAVGTVTLSSFTQEDYYRAVCNRAAGEELFGAEEAVNLRSLTYRQLYWLLGRSGSYLLYIGGVQTREDATVLRAIHTLAAERQVVVYHFDPKLDGGSASQAFGYGEGPDISDSACGLSGLYGDILEKLAYDGEALPENFFLAYNKNTADENGHSAPILAGTGLGGLSGEELDAALSLVLEGYAAAEFGTALSGPDSAPDAGNQSGIGEAAQAGGNLLVLAPRLVSALLIAAIVAVTLCICSHRDKKWEEAAAS